MTGLATLAVLAYLVCIVGAFKLDLATSFERRPWVSLGFAVIWPAVVLVALAMFATEPLDAEEASHD